MVNLFFATLFLAVSCLVFFRPASMSRRTNRIFIDLEKKITGLYVRSGLSWKLKPMIHAYAALTLFQVLFFLWVATSKQTPVALVVSILSVALPIVALKKKADARISMMLQEIPSTLELAALCMRAGHDILSALTWVSDRNGGSELSRELKLALQSTNLGLSRSGAFLLLYERTQLPELHQLAITIAQSEEYGHSLSAVLESQAWAIRQKLFRMSEQQAQKAPYKMLIPLLGLIFPVTFVLLFGPLVLKLLKM